jgi:hypothetical protein
MARMLLIRSRPQCNEWRTRHAKCPRHNEEQVMNRMMMMWMFGVPLSVMLLFMVFGII